ncbi:MAG: threonylcarbamoyl-AMP synthase [Deferribacterales bacterium]|nr:threonylcarbamoyl-AMP synthase [Deferribacterales bacterium]
MIIINASKEAGLFIFKKSAVLNVPAIFPTDTVYGIGAPLSAIEANLKIYQIKRRSKDLPFPILAGSLKQVETIAYTDNICYEAKTYLKKWPGPYTFILKSKPSLNPLFCKNGTVAVRIPDEEWLQEAINNLGEPVTATSANVSGQCHINSIEPLITAFSDSVPLFIKGVAKQNCSSSIFDLSDDTVIKVR